MGGAHVGRRRDHLPEVGRLPAVRPWETGRDDDDSSIGLALASSDPEEDGFRRLLLAALIARRCHRRCSNGDEPVHDFAELSTQGGRSNSIGHTDPQSGLSAESQIEVNSTIGQKAEIGTGVILSGRLGGIGLSSSLAWRISSGSIGAMPLTGPRP
jgi:hypothetical protein